MTEVPALLTMLSLVSGSAIVRRAPTWTVERAGWLLIFVSAGVLLSIVAHS